MKIYRTEENPLNVETETIDFDNIGTGCIITFKCKLCNCDALYPFTHKSVNRIVERKLCKSCVRKEQNKKHSEYWSNRSEDEILKTRKKHSSTIMSKSKNELKDWRNKIVLSRINKSDEEKQKTIEKWKNTYANRTEEQKEQSSKKMSNHSWAKKPKHEKEKNFKKKN